MDGATQDMAREYAAYTQEVLTAYRARGSKLRNTVALDAAPYEGGELVTGEDYVDNVPDMLAKPDERAVAASAGAYALGSKIDEEIIARLDRCPWVLETHPEPGMTVGKAVTAVGQLRQRSPLNPLELYFAAVGAHQWNELLDIADFRSAPCAGTAFPWLKGTESRIWLDTVWMFHTGLPLSGGRTTRHCLLWRRRAVRLSEGAGISVAEDWDADKAAHHLSYRLAAQVRLGDPDAALVIHCDDNSGRG